MLRSIALRFWASLLLVTTLGGVAVPLFGDLHTGSDIACADEAWTDAGHHTRTQIEGVRPPLGHDHCAVCHLQRALGGAVNDGNRFTSVEPATAPALPPADAHTRELSRRGDSSRAPPTSFL